VYKIAKGLAELASCILPHAYSRTLTIPSCESTNKNFFELF